MPQASVRLTDPEARRRAASWVYGADPGTVVTFATPDKRYGQWLSPDDWKLLFLADMDRGARMVPALDGRGWVNLNTSSSALRIAEFAALLDAIHKFAADHGVQLGRPV